jgi:hypothetical protein
MSDRDVDHSSPRAICEEWSRPLSAVGFAAQSFAPTLAMILKHRDRRTEYTAFEAVQSMQPAPNFTGYEMLITSRNCQLAAVWKQ